MNRNQPSGIQLAVILFLTSFSALQVSPPEHPHNPVVIPENTIESQTQIPLQVKSTIQRACKNCHSYETTWPWYSKVAPASWLLVKDGNAARQALDFSDFDTRENLRTAMAELMAACADVQSGRMPPPSYRVLHSEARLTDAEKRSFCSWSSATVLKLKR